jgi:preprotein translocase subunit SecY
MFKDLDDSNSLFNRIFLTLRIIILIRIGTFIPIPGINQEYLYTAIKTTPALSMLRTFFQGDFFVLGIFSLGILPNINASIIIQLLTSIFPSLQKLQKEEGSAGRRQLTQITRYLTFAIALLYSLSISFAVKPFMLEWSFTTVLPIVIALTTGSMVTLWFSEIITEKGLGNGSSILISIGILSALPKTLESLLVTKDLTVLISAFLIFSVIVLGVIFLQEATKIIPLVSAKELMSESSISGETYLPFRLNQAGVMPVIFASTLLGLPAFISNTAFFQKLIVSVPAISKVFVVGYFLFYFGLILFFSIFYSTIVLDPKDLSVELKKMSVRILNVRPGIETENYLRDTLNSLSLFGGIFLSFLVTGPNIITALSPTTSSLRGFGSTSLIILVGVAIEISRQIRTILITKKYDNMLL